MPIYGTMDEDPFGRPVAHNMDTSTTDQASASTSYTIMSPRASYFTSPKSLAASAASATLGHPSANSPRAASMDAGVSVAGTGTLASPSTIMRPVSPPTPAPSPQPDTLHHLQGGGNNAIPGLQPGTPVTPSEEEGDDDDDEEPTGGSPSLGPVYAHRLSPSFAHEAWQHALLAQSPTPGAGYYAQDSVFYDEADTSGRSDGFADPETIRTQYAAHLIQSLVAYFPQLNASEKRALFGSVVPLMASTDLAHLSQLISPFLRRDFLSDLPSEIALHILSFLDDPKDLVRASQVSRSWRTVVADEHNWKLMLQRYRGRGWAAVESASATGSANNSPMPSTRARTSIELLQHAHPEAHFGHFGALALPPTAASSQRAGITAAQRFVYGRAQMPQPQRQDRLPIGATVPPVGVPNNAQATLEQPQALEPAAHPQQTSATVTGEVPLAAEAVEIQETAEMKAKADAEAAVVAMLFAKAQIQPSAVDSANHEAAEDVPQASSSTAPLPPQTREQPALSPLAKPFKLPRLPVVDERIYPDIASDTASPGSTRADSLSAHSRASTSDGQDGTHETRENATPRRVKGKGRARQISNDSAASYANKTHFSGFGTAPRPLPASITSSKKSTIGMLPSGDLRRSLASVSHGLETLNPERPRPLLHPPLGQVLHQPSSDEQMAARLHAMALNAPAARQAAALFRQMHSDPSVRPPAHVIAEAAAALGYNARTGAILHETARPIGSAPPVVPFVLPAHMRQETLSDASASDGYPPGSPMNTSSAMESEVPKSAVVKSANPFGFAQTNLKYTQPSLFTAPVAKVPEFVKPSMPFSYKTQFKKAYLTESNWLRGPGRILSRQTSTDDGVVTSLGIDNEWIVVGMATNQIHVFDAKTGAYVQQLLGHSLGVWCLVLVSKGGHRLNQDGKRVVDEETTPKDASMQTASAVAGSERAEAEPLISHEDGRPEAAPTSTGVAHRPDSTTEAIVEQADLPQRTTYLSNTPVFGPAEMEGMPQPAYIPRAARSAAQDARSKFEGSASRSDTFPFAPTGFPFGGTGANVSAQQAAACGTAQGWGQPGAIAVSGGCDRNIRVWDVATGRCLHVLRGHMSTVRCVKVLDGRPIAVSGSRDNTLRVWDIEQGTLLKLLNGHRHSVRCLEICGNKVVSGSYDATCKIWDVDTGECLHTLQGHQHQIYAVAFDGVRVASGSLDSTVRVWSATTGECLAMLQGHTSLVGQLQLTDSVLVTGGSDGRVIVFSLSTFECLHRLCAHDNSVTCLQFNDRFMVTGGNDGRVKLWDRPSGKLIRDLAEPCEAVWRVTFREDKCVLLCKRSGRTIMEVRSFAPLEHEL